MNLISYNKRIIPLNHYIFYYSNNKKMEKYKMKMKKFDKDVHSSKESDLPEILLISTVAIALAARLIETTFY